MNSKIHPASVFTDLPSFNHWFVPPTQRTVIRTTETEYRPVSTLAAGSKIEFNIATAPNEFINFSKSKLYVRMNVKLAKVGSPSAEITANDWKDVGTVNYLLHSLFSNVEVVVANKETLLTPTTYAHRAHIEALAGYSADARSSHLTSALWFENHNDRKQIIAPVLPVIQASSSNTENDGPQLSTDLSSGKKFEMCGPLHIDYAFQSRPLMSGTEYKVVLYQNTPEFYMLCPAEYRASVELDEVAYFVVKHEVAPEFVNDYYKMLLSTSARFPMVRTEVRQYTIAQKQMEYSFDNVCNSVLPRRMLVALVESEAFNGKYTKDPFEYKHFNCNFVASYVNGVQYPQKAYQPNFKDDLYIREYNGFISAINQDTFDCLTTINRTQYKRNNVIFGFNYSADLSNGVTSAGHVSLQQYGNLRLHLRFAKALPEAINVICFLQFDRILEIDKDRIAK